MKRLSIFTIAFSLIVVAVGGSSVVGEQRDVASLGFVKGFSWGWIGSRGEYASPAAAESLGKLADTGTEWACIAFAGRMVTPETPEIRWSDREPRMIADDELRHAIDLAREKGLRVILKPMIICDDNTWRAWIKFFRPVIDEERAAGVTGERDPWSNTPVFREGEVRDLEKWDRWWADHSAFLLHYAKIAEEKQVPVLCIGCEMNSTEEFEDRWRELIAEIRKVYSGLLTYDVNHGRERELAWWDTVDFISISAYYQVPPPQGTTIEEAVEQTTTRDEIIGRLQSVKQELARISAEHGKPILFIETGVTNVRGCARYPWSHPNERMESPLDEQEQANYYQAMFEVFWDEPWFMGWCWWDWPARLYDRSEADRNRGFCVYGKQAEEVLREWYAKPR